MKKFILVILSVMIAAATLFTACTGSSVDSGVSTGSSADGSDVQSAISSEDGDFSVDDKLSPRSKAKA